MTSTWRGVLFFLAAWAVIPNMDVAAKLLGQWGYPVVMVVWGRFAFSLVILSPTLLTRRRDIFKPPAEAGKHVLRGLLLVAATFGFFLGLKTMALADALEASPAPALQAALATICWTRTRAAPTPL